MNKILILIIFIIFIIIIGIVIYLFFKNKKCPPNQIYDQGCHDICKNGTVWSNEYHKCIPTCQKGYQYHEENGKWCCVSTDSNGNVICSAGQHWNQDTCSCANLYNDSDCAPCIDTKTGIPINEGMPKSDKTYCGVPSDAGDKCSYDPSSSTLYSTKMQKACVSVGFDKFDITTNKCVSKQDCCKNVSNTTGFNLNILPNTCKIFNKHNTDDFTCSDPSINDMKNACIYDSNGCEYGYAKLPSGSYGGSCTKQGNPSQPPFQITTNCGGTNITGGCRPSDKNYLWKGSSCFDATISQDIKVQIISSNTKIINVNITMPTVNGETNPNFRYAILNVVSENQNSDSEIRVGEVSSGSPSVIQLTGDEYNTYLDANINYALFIYGVVNVQGGVATIKHISVSPNGDTFSPNPAPDDTSAIPVILIDVEKSLSDNIAKKNGDEILGEYINMNLYSKDAVPPSNGWPYIPIADLPYTICPLIHGEGLIPNGAEFMAIIIAWNTYTLTKLPTKIYNSITSTYKNPIIAYYIERGNSLQPEFEPTALNIKLPSGSYNNYIIDIPSAISSGNVNTHWMYRIGTYIKDSMGSATTYQTAIFKSDFRLVMVDIPSFSQDLCNTISTDDPNQIPPFLVLDPNIGVCASPSVMDPDGSKQWYCMYYDKTTNTIKKNPPTSNINLWDGISCSKVNVNNETVLSYIDDTGTSHNDTILNPTTTYTPDLLLNKRCIVGFDSNRIARCGCQTNIFPKKCSSVALMNWGTTNAINETDFETNINKAIGFGGAYISHFDQSNEDQYAKTNIIGKMVNCPVSLGSTWGYDSNKCSSTDNNCINLANSNICSGNNKCDPSWQRYSSNNDYMAFQSAFKWLPPNNSNECCNNHGLYSSQGSGSKCVCDVNWDTTPQCSTQVLPLYKCVRKGNGSICLPTTANDPDGTNKSDCENKCLCDPGWQRPNGQPNSQECSVFKCGDQNLWDWNNVSGQQGCYRRPPSNKGSCSGAFCATQTKGSDIGWGNWSCAITVGSGCNKYMKDQETIPFGFNTCLYSGGAPSWYKCDKKEGCNTSSCLYQTANLDKYCNSSIPIQNFSNCGLK